MKLNYTILFIEDDKASLDDSIEELMEWDRTLNIIPSETGERLEVVLKNPLDMVVCDFNLGTEHFDGIDIIQRIRSINKYCKVIFYTGVEPQITRERFRDLLKYHICRYVVREELEDVITEEIKEGMDILSIIDRWLTYYDKDDADLSFLGSHFEEKKLSDIAVEVRKKSKLGQEFSKEFTTIMLNYMGLE